MTTKAIVTGITGQDGSYLAELLLEKGYDVYGIMRRSSTFNTSRINHLLFPEEKITLIYGDLNEGLDRIIYDIQPDFIFNMASQSHVRVSFDVPIYTMITNAVGPVRILESIRKLGLQKKTRFYQASSSEMFGMSPPPQNENTPFLPCSPYGIAKLAAYWATKTYRDGYDVFAANGILFNHTSPRRGENFVEMKVIRGAVRIKLGKQDKLILGNLKAKRDWGFSKDYMKGVIKIVEHDTPDDFVIASEQQYTIEEFVSRVFEKLDMDWQEKVGFDKRYLRPKEVPDLLGDASRLKKVLKWEPEISFEELMDMMIRDVYKQEIGNV